MHICFITHEYPLWSTGGIGSFIQTLGKELVKNKVTVTIVGIGQSNKEEQIDDEGITIYRLKKSNWHFGRFIPNSIAINKKLSQINNYQPIDIIESPETGLAFLKAKTTWKKVIRLHGGHHFFAEGENRGINPWKGFQERISFRKADAFVAVSKYVKNHTEKFLNYRNKPCPVIRLPINIELFAPQEETSVIKHRIVFAGTICEKKGIRQLIEAMPFILEKFNDAHLDVYGRDWSYKKGKSFLSYLKNNSPDEVLNHITFHGTIPFNTIPEKYAIAEVCVFPSHIETQGLVAPEAMCMAKPVVFSRTGPGPETIEHKITGMLCDPHNPHDIANQVIYLFNNPNAAIAMGQKAREFVLSNFDIKKITQQNIDFYKSLINK